MIHRHLDVPPDTAPEDLPSAAIADILDRGDLDDWRGIAAAVARAPRGELAKRISALVDAFPSYGTSPLWRAFLERCRVRALVGGLPAPPVRLAELRRRAGLRQLDVARRLGMTQSDVSKLERRGDPRTGTLRRYIEALGARMRILCETRGETFDLRLPRVPAHARAAPPDPEPGAEDRKPQPPPEPPPPKP